MTVKKASLRGKSVNTVDDRANRGNNLDGMAVLVN